MSTFIQAAVYYSGTAYLNAIKETRTDNSDVVRKALGNMTINDMFVHDGKILANGLMLHDMQLMEVKPKSESQGSWDLLKVVSTVPAKDAFIPLSKSACPLVHH